MSLCYNNTVSAEPEGRTMWCESHLPLRLEVLVVVVHAGVDKRPVQRWAPLITGECKPPPLASNLIRCSFLGDRKYRSAVEK